MGASAVHDPRGASPVDFIAGHYGCEEVLFARSSVALADMVFDCAGVASVLEDAVHSLKVRGRLVIVADPHDLSLPYLRLVMQRELSVIGAVGYDDEFTEAIALLGSGAVDLTPLVTHRFALSDLDQAFAMQADPQQAIKVMVKAGTN